MAPYRTLPDHGVGLAKAVNALLLWGDALPVRGTVDYAVGWGPYWVGVELKTGAWNQAARWEPQLKRHLAHYPRVLLVMVSPDAAQTRVPALVLCSR